LERSSPKTYQNNDERYWKPEVDKAGTGSAVIRFLPAKMGEEYPFVELHTHGFQGPTGKWFIDNCPTSIGEKCPACEANSLLWNTGTESNKKLASARKRKLNNVSNILVVSDPKHPENNGKVFLYRYGKKIFDKIKDMIAPPPEFADMEPIDPFSLEEGANFKLRIIRADGFPNYDKSSFDGASAVGDEDRIAEIEAQLHSVNEVLDVKNFKSYEKLKERFLMVTAGAEPATSDDESQDDELPVAKPKAVNKTVAPKVAGKTAKAKAPATAGADEEDADYFARLAESEDE
jgi:hypothetical protein